ncbi:competence protein CoiA [Ktedonobacter sp. SOSP1-52]|uniref:competence protein CoiA n=1 Tax=Ktedonobacter sp. SOSP1-52 TaxID=2778366 RepID=UPI001914F70E|nr:competence protein CoiA family protein [Ktedonobacter sp. SOSP1-52]
MDKLNEVGAMLVAYGPEGQTVVASETPLEQLQEWSRDRLLQCPNCRGVVHLRGGGAKRMQPHFAHQRGECAWSTEGESVQHMRGKAVLARWLKGQFPEAQVTLEERLPEPNRIADVFVRHTDGQCQAVEYQCAPLEIEEWQMRHEAYRKAGIIDTWIIGSNRREKQEAFIDAVIQIAHEALFLDSQVTPPRTWLRWPITRQVAQEWQSQVTPQARRMPTLEGWVGRQGYGATLIGPLHEIRINREGRLLHPVRIRMEERGRLLQQMSQAQAPEPGLMAAYLRTYMDEAIVHGIIVPLLKSYLLDPELLQRYNYGRGLPQRPLNVEDRARVEKAKAWLRSLGQKGYTGARLQEIARELPFVGPYAAFASYMELLVTLSGGLSQ